MDTPLNHDRDTPPDSDRVRFLNLAAIFEGGMVVVALGLAALLHIDAVDHLQIDAAGTLIGFAAAIPPFVVMFFAENLRLAPLVRIKQIVLDVLGPQLAACRWYDIVLLSALAGFGEELLFRGVVQPFFEHWGWTAGILISNLIFGLLHMITPTYAILAGGMGIYFGLLLDITGTRNLLAPILAHGFYDYLAFITVISTLRKQQALGATNPDLQTKSLSEGPSQAPPPA